MSHIETFEDSALIEAILNLAILDAFNFKRPKPPKKFVRPRGSKKKNKYLDFNYVSDDPEYLSWDARTFLKADNKLFSYYCWNIDIDPEFLAEKIEKKLKLFDKSRNKILKGIDFINVNTL